ncbi:hypothetical protein [Budvicia aquatica]|uniref:hypothetical protein n=1 Tax=Budvicia aquatica TaxID=82979 RepID=UPI00207FF141|nr:hypothetical protein [Budvicia aquatica]GKX50575.1 hypothetical protein SOASR029_08840 [Budvicia aquatica]
MDWTYGRKENQCTVIHKPTGIEFAITHGAHSYEVKDLELINKESVTLLSPQIDALRQEIKNIIIEKELKNAMGHFISFIFVDNITNAAFYLQKVTGKKVSARTIQAWLMPVTSASARKCPKWAVDALQSYKDNNSQEIKEIRIRENNILEHRLKQNIPINANDIMHNDVKFAESELQDEKALKEWVMQTTPQEALTYIIDRLYTQNREIRGLSRCISNMNLACITSNSFEEFKSKYQRQELEDSYRDSLINKAKRDIINNNAEFSTDDATIPE